MAELAENTPAPDQAQKKKRPRKLLILGGVCLVNVVLLVLLVSQLLTPASNTPSDPLVGHPAPGFSLALLSPQNNKSTLSLAELKGKPVVLNFWATWCAPCKEELPLLEQTWAQLQAQGKDVVFLGIDFQEAASDAAAFLQPYGITYPILLDVDGAVTIKFGITALPQTVFINRAGGVASRIPGELTSQTLSNSLRLIP